MPFHIQGSSLIFIYSFFLSFSLFFLIFFLSLFLFSLLHVFPPIELYGFFCFLYPFVLESHIKQDVTLRLVVLLTITPKKLLTAVQVNKKKSELTDFSTNRN